MSEHQWAHILKEKIAAEYGEPEKENEHCRVAASAALNYLMEQGYDADNVVEGGLYELYLFARYLHGTGALQGRCVARMVSHE